MKVVFLAILIVSISCEMLVTKEYTDYLKKHATWEVQDYEENIFRGFTVEEASMFLGATMPETTDYIPAVEPKDNLPSAVNWAGASCDNGVRTQGQCGASWAFAVTGMLSDRCCIQGHDHGWLAPQELINCDKKSHGCNGGWGAWALDYVMSVKGLALEACFPYMAQDLPCSSTCVDGRPIVRLCNCVNGYKTLTTLAAIKTALRSGPITIVMMTCNSFFNYKSGIYKCDCLPHIVGLLAVVCYGYTDRSTPYLTCKNSWGPLWGRNGYFDIDSSSCGLPSRNSSGNVVCDKVEP